MRPRIINKSSRTKHDVDAASLRNLPQMISEPIFVFKRSDDALGVLTEIKDRNGKNVCVAIEVNRTIQDGGTMLEVNDIRSIHGRDVANIVLPIVHNNTLVYADKTKGLNWLSSASYDYQQEIDKKDLDSATKVVENFDNPTIEEDILFRDGDPEIHEKALARELSFDEAIANGLLELAEQNAGNYQLRVDALKGFTKLLENAAKDFVAARVVRGVAARQKDYDKATAQKVINLASLIMNNSLIDGFTRGEVKRLMGTIHRAVGKKDLMKQGSEVVSLLADRQLKVCEELLLKQLKTKASKINASGVETQAGLDIKGQRVMAA